jgi:hypothetical protein
VCVCVLGVCEGAHVVCVRESMRFGVCVSMFVFMCVCIRVELNGVHAEHNDALGRRVDVRTSLLKDRRYMPKV